MIRAIIERILHLFRAKESPQDSPQMLVAAPVPETRLREMLRTKKDFAVRATPDGLISAVCGICGEALDVVMDGELLWFRCAHCDLVSFDPMLNVQRNIHFANQDTEPFEYELFYMRNLPPEFPSPFRKA